MTGQDVLIHIKTMGKIEDSVTYSQHGVKETGISKGGDSWYLLNSFETINTHPYFGSVVSDGYCIKTISSKAGTYSYSLTIDGVTKTVSFTVLDRATEFKKWYKTRLENISRQVAIQNAPSGSVFLESLSVDIKEVAGKLEWMNKNYGFIQGGEEGVSCKTKVVTRVIGGVSQSVNLQFVNIYSTFPWWITSKSDLIYRGIEIGGCFSG